MDMTHGHGHGHTWDEGGASAGVDMDMDMDVHNGSRGICVFVCGSGGYGKWNML